MRINFFIITSGIGINYITHIVHNLSPLKHSSQAPFNRLSFHWGKSVFHKGDILHYKTSSIYDAINCCPKKLQRVSFVWL